MTLKMESFKFPSTKHHYIEQLSLSQASVDQQLRTIMASFGGPRTPGSDGNSPHLTDSDAYRSCTPSPSSSQWSPLPIFTNETLNSRFNALQGAYSAANNSVVEWNSPNPHTACQTAAEPTNEQSAEEMRLTPNVKTFTLVADHDASDDSEEDVIVSTLLIRPCVTPLGIRSEDLTKPDAIAHHVSVIVAENEGCDFDPEQYVWDQNSSTPYSDVVKSRRAAKDGHIKRPLNAFFLFSVEERNRLRNTQQEMHNAQISKHLGLVWKNLDKHIKDKCKARARILRDLFERQYPSYKYRPQKKGKAEKDPTKIQSGRVRKATAKTSSAKPRKSAATSRSKKVPVQTVQTTEFVQNNTNNMQRFEIVQMPVTVVEPKVEKVYDVDFTLNGNVYSAQTSNPFVYSPSTTTVTTDHLQQHITIQDGRVTGSEDARFKQIYSFLTEDASVPQMKSDDLEGLEYLPGQGEMDSMAPEVLMCLIKNEFGDQNGECDWSLEADTAPQTSDYIFTPVPYTLPDNLFESDMDDE